MLMAWGVWASQTLPTLLTWHRLKTPSPVSKLYCSRGQTYSSLSRYSGVSRPKGSRLWICTNYYSPTYIHCFLRGWISQQYWFFLPWEELCADYKTAFCFFPPQPCRAACGILVPWPGIEPGPSAVRARSPNHCTAREFPKTAFNWGLWTPLYARFWVNGFMYIFWIDFTMLTADMKKKVEMVSVNLFLRWQSSYPATGQQNTSWRKSQVQRVSRSVLLKRPGTSVRLPVCLAMVAFAIFLTGCLFSF